jgi:hypothetical protein
MGLSGFLIGLGITVYKVLNSFGFIRSINISKLSFTGGIIYYKEYTGSYKKIGENFKDIAEIIKKFKLSDYCIIAIYYDDAEKTEENKQKAIYGLYKKINVKNFKPNDDLEEYLKEHKYIKGELSNTNSLYASWEYVNIFSMLLGIKKFYQTLHKNLKDEHFKKLYRIKEDQFKLCIELYDSDTSMSFFIPLINHEQFMLHKDLKKDK